MEKNLASYIKSAAQIATNITQCKLNPNLVTGNFEVKSFRRRKDVLEKKLKKKNGSICMNFRYFIK